MVNCQADHPGLTVLDTSAVLSITGPSATQTGQGGGSLTMLIKHQGGGAQPRAQPTRDWEDSNTCTYGLPEYTTSREHVLHHTGEREEERKGKKSRVLTVLVYNIILWLFKNFIEIIVVCIGCLKKNLFSLNLIICIINKEGWRLEFSKILKPALASFQIGAQAASQDSWTHSEESANVPHPDTPTIG